MAANPTVVGVTRGSDFHSCGSDTWQLLTTACSAYLRPNGGQAREHTLIEEPTQHLIPKMRIRGKHVSVCTVQRGSCCCGRDTWQRSSSSQLSIYIDILRRVDGASIVAVIASFAGGKVRAAVAACVQIQIT